MNPLSVEILEAIRSDKSDKIYKKSCKFLILQCEKLIDEAKVLLATWNAIPENVRESVPATSGWESPLNLFNYAGDAISKSDDFEGASLTGIVYEVDDLHRTLKQMKTYLTIALGIIEVSAPAE